MAHRISSHPNKVSRPESHKVAFTNNWAISKIPRPPLHNSNLQHLENMLYTKINLESSNSEFNLVNHTESLTSSKIKLLDFTRFPYTSMTPISTKFWLGW